MNERENSNQSANTLGGINDMHEGFMGTGMVPDDVEMPNLVCVFFKSHLIMVWFIGRHAKCVGIVESKRKSHS